MGTDLAKEMREAVAAARKDPNGLRFLRAYPVTHRFHDRPPVERFEWQLDTDYGFSFHGTGENHDGWRTAKQAKEAGLRTMRAYFAQRRR